MKPAPDNITPEELIRRGYRRISKWSGYIARIDKAGWLQYLAQEQHCNIEDLDPVVWADWYRRNVSKDVLIVDLHMIKRIPTSCDDPTGFVDWKNNGNRSNQETK